MRSADVGKDQDTDPNRKLVPGGWVNLKRRSGRRPRQYLPFAKISSQPDRIPPGRARFWKITPHELDQIVALCKQGTHPKTATVMVLKVSGTCFDNWRVKGEDENGDQRYRMFVQELFAAYQSARSDCEQAVKESDPLAALTRGPLGAPDWHRADSSVTVRHEGEIVQRVKLHVSPKLGISSELITATQICDTPEIEE